MIDQPYQFDFYDGGGLDVAFLGLAQADREGNLNVSKFGPRLAGAGGFINISQNAQEGRVRRHVQRVRSGGRRSRTAGSRSGRRAASASSSSRSSTVTYSGEVALRRGQDALYVTERCVFRLTEGGLELDRDRAGDRPGTRHPVADGVPAGRVARSWR